MQTLSLTMQSIAVYFLKKNKAVLLQPFLKCFTLSVFDTA